MMSRCSLAVALAASALLFAGTASAQQSSVGISGGTPGLGIEYSHGVNEAFSIRINGNWFSLSRGVESEDVAYDGKLKLFTVGVLGDYYPFSSGFRVSGGAYYNKNRFNLVMTPTGDMEIGDTTYTPAQIGSLTGNISFNKLAPYAGIGYTTNRGNPGFSMVFDLGVMLQGRPNVTLAGNGGVAATPGFQADLERERASIAHDIRIFKVYPAIRSGWAYRF